MGRQVHEWEGECIDKCMYVWMNNWVESLVAGGLRYLLYLAVASSFVVFVLHYKIPTSC